MNSQIQELRGRIKELENDIETLAAMILHIAGAPKNGTVHADILFDVSLLVPEKDCEEEESVEDTDAEMDNGRTKPNNLQAEPVDYITTFPDSHHVHTSTCMPNWIDDPASTNGSTSCGNCHHMSFCPHASMPNP